MSLFLVFLGDGYLGDHDGDGEDGDFGVGWLSFDFWSWCGGLGRTTSWLGGCEGWTGGWGDGKGRRVFPVDVDVGVVAVVVGVVVTLGRGGWAEAGAGPVLGLVVGGGGLVGGEEEV